MKTLLALAAAAFVALAASSAEAQRARSMYSMPGADAPQTTQSARSPLEGTWVGSIAGRDGVAKPISIRVYNVAGGFASINRNNGDSGGGRVSGNSVSFGNRTPMTLTVSGGTARLTGSREDGSPISAVLRKQ